MSAVPIVGEAIHWITERELGVQRHGPHSLGSVILKPEDPKIIDGVRVTPFDLWPDDRGYFLEVTRMGQGLSEGFGETTQVSATLSYPGTIKALHYHRRQTDVWVPVRGMLQVMLYDLRAGSPS